MLIFFFVLLIIIIIVCQYFLIKASKTLPPELRQFEHEFGNRQQLIYSGAILAGFIFIVAVPRLTSWLTLLITLTTLVVYLQFEKFKTLKRQQFPTVYRVKSLAFSSINYLAEFGLLLIFFLAT